MIYLLSLLAFLIPSSAFAIAACPVCTVAVGACLEISRKFGVDDSIIGLWAGALTFMMALWAIEFFKARKWNFILRDFILIILTYAMYIPLYFNGTIVYKGSVHWGQDAFLLGLIVGSIIFVGVSKLYDVMKAHNGGHAHFPFEKVVLPLIALAAASAFFYFDVCK